MNIPNKITILRLLISVVAAVLMLFNLWISAFILVVIFWALDAVDGNLARRLKQETPQGVFMDLLSDKFLMISSFLIIGVRLDILFFYLGVLMLLRDFVMDFLRITAASRAMVISPDKIGKFKGILFIVSSAGMILNKIAFGTNQTVQTSMILIASFGIALSYITLIVSLFRNKKILK
jgi:CDP-diacylglycerol--glycerol-3-phosphate 3-phosphatidyltransferase